MRAGSDEENQFSCFLADSALDVLLAGRLLIHTGWKLLQHPLYGNYRPHQQPYRSLILEHNPAAIQADGGLSRIIPDDWSLHLIEEAINVYQSVAMIVPSDAPPSLREDCALLDLELMRLPLTQAGWPEEALGPRA